MNNPKKTHELIQQNEQNVKKSKKHDANLQKNSTLYFQVGLIVCLLAAYGLFEMKFETNIPVVCNLPNLEEPVYVDIPIIKTKVPELIEPIKQKQKKQSQTFEEVPDETPELPFVDEPKKPVVDTPLMNPSDLPPIEVPDDNEPVPFISIEQVPIYPGCENKKTNDLKRKCMSEKITKLVQRKFNTGLASGLGLSGKQVIRTQFKIDKTGNVIDIKTNGTHPKLEKEAERIINKIPEMTPGKQRDKNVDVIYSLPIVFQVQY